MAEFFASTAKGLESLCLAELQDLGVEDAKATLAGVNFSGDLQLAYRVCLWSRTASRVMLRLVEAEINSADELYHEAAKVNWSSLFALNQTFSVNCAGTNEFITNSQFAALKVKDAIVDQFSMQFEKRPDVSKVDADVRVAVKINRNRLAISMDLVGPPLHRRGYRSEQGEAPLKENLAAALVMRSRWTEPYLIDPMCGSGTILIEAAMMGADIAPGLERSFAFTKLKNFSESAWKEELNKAQMRAEVGRRDCKRKLIGYDLDRRMVNIAKANIERAGLNDLISVHTHDAADLPEGPKSQGLILSNPPYGERLGEMTQLIGLFLGLGAKIKQNYPGWRVGLFTAAPELLDYLRMRSDKQYKFFNGALEGVLKLYQVGEGAGSGEQKIYAEDFVNRLKKNQKKLQKWIKRDNITCYRLYDADLPEYNVAVDCYEDYTIIQEYKAPKTIDANKARRRFMDVLTGLIQSGLADKSKIIIKQRSQQKGKQQYQVQATEKQRMVVEEYGAQFYVNLFDYLDTGLFLDHRNMRHYLQQHSQGKRVLNLFAYTGTASVHAAIGGASKVTTVDMSNTYLNWARDNFRLNKLSIGQHQFVRADCIAWLKHAPRNSYDLVFLDPPTFSNSKKMDDVFDVQRDHGDLIAQVSQLLSEQGQLIFSNNKRHFKMDMEKMSELGLSVKNISAQSLSPDFERNKHIHNCWLISKAQA